MTLRLLTLFFLSYFYLIGPFNYISLCNIRSTVVQFMSICKFHCKNDNEYTKNETNFKAYLCSEQSLRILKLTKM